MGLIGFCRRRRRIQYATWFHEDIPAQNCRSFPVGRRSRNRRSPTGQQPAGRDLLNFTGSGGIIQSMLKENNARFEVNVAAAGKTGLSFSSQFLKVATDIRK